MTRRDESSILEIGVAVGDGPDDEHGGDAGGGDGDQVEDGEGTDDGEVLLVGEHGNSCAVVDTEAGPGGVAGAFGDINMEFGAGGPFIGQ